MGALDPEAAPPVLTDDAATRVAAGENGAMPSWLRALAVHVTLIMKSTPPNSFSNGAAIRMR